MTVFDEQTGRTEQRLRAGILELMANGESLERLLTLLTERVCLCCDVAAFCLLRVREGHMVQTAAYALPSALSAAIQQLCLDGEESMALLNSPPSGDLRTCAEWSRMAAEVHLTGLYGLWSWPVCSAAGEMLGVLFGFLPMPRDPLPEEQEAMRTAEHLISLVIEQRNMMDELRYQATHDLQTGLGNRRFLGEQLAAAMEQAKLSGEMVGLLRLDLDRFQVVNDLLGHDTGDRLLEQVARRMEKCVRHTDTVARTGGDEFTLLLPGMRSVAVAQSVAAKLLEEVGRPIHVKGHELTITTSIGVSVYPRDASTPEGLQSAAEDAMMSCKKNTRNAVAMFDPAHSSAARQKSLIESSLRGALVRHEMQLNYQPLVDVRTGAIVGAEALVRWIHPEIGTVSPGVFIPLAEETGLIHPLGEWIFRQACLTTCEWNSRYGWTGKTGINVSGLQFGQPEFLHLVSAVVAETRVNPRQITIEVTETAFLDDLSEAASRMRRLNELGIGVSMDDFGTGYASLSYLQSLPFDSVKIDLSFVREITSLSDRPPVITNMIAMIHALGKRAVAEGVETEQQLGALTAMGCDVVQGYLLGRPLPGDAFIAKHLITQHLTPA